MFKYKIICFLACIFLISGSIFAVQKPTIHSKAAILQDFETGSILYGKNIDEKIYPASTTKILTAIVAIENSDLNKIVTAQYETLKKLPINSSNAHILSEEKLSMRELLETLIVVSGNDSALVIAEDISGNIENFVNLMNETAKKIGCTNTHFMNPHGYHDDNHYTTPRDMMKILNYGLQYDEFKKLLSTKEVSIAATNKNNIRNYKSTNRLFFKPEEIGQLAHYYEYNKGGKTGFTNEALRTFVGFAEKDGRTLLIGTFGIMNVNGVDGKFLDAVSLYDHGFNDFSKQVILKKNTHLFTEITKNEKKDFYAKEDIYALLPSDYKKLNIRISLDELNNNTYKNLYQEENTENYTICFNSTNLEANPEVYMKTTKINYPFYKKILDRISINIYNLKLLFN